MSDNNGANPEAEFPEYLHSFDKCPACGSKERFFEALSAEVREKGLAGKDFSLALDARHNVVVSKEKELTLKTGDKMPAFAFLSDICSDCGLIYAVKLQRMTAVKQLPAPQLIVPGRAQRRRMERDSEFPHRN